MSPLVASTLMSILGRNLPHALVLRWSSRRLLHSSSPILNKQEIPVESFGATNEQAAPNVYVGATTSDATFQPTSKVKSYKKKASVKKSKAFVTSNDPDKPTRQRRKEAAVDLTVLHKLNAELENIRKSSAGEGDKHSSVTRLENIAKALTQDAQFKKAKKKKALLKPKKLPPPHQQMEPSVYTALDTIAKTIKGTEQGGWGPDRLKPTNKPLGSDRKLKTQNAVGATGRSTLERPAYAPHLEPPPTLAYSRRIEGLLEHTSRPTLEDVPPPSEQYPIATLAHGLDRVLFNPGVHWLRDPRSKVYNFPPHLEEIPRVTDFAFERLGGFIKSSRDEDLWALARREKRTFAGSTSSLSGMLSHVYFLISGDKDVNTNNLSRNFGNEPRTFTSGQRIPATVLLNHRDGMYAIDSAGEKDSAAEKNILTWLGTLLERYLTSTPEEFAPYMRFNPPSPPMEKKLRDAYRYAKSEKFVMRSQLDCVDTRLPGTGVFDIKTRACLPIRMDLLNFEENSGYLLRSLTGKLESFEKEYYDLIRSAFLKYSFQVRIGNMDGVIVAYHNTARLFGFQYISLAEMDECLYGAGEGIGDKVFNKCVGLLEKILEEATACFPGESVKCTFEKLEGEGVLKVWVEPEVSKVEEGQLTPLKQLEVRVNNFLGQVPVRGSSAVTATDEPWTTHWSISKLIANDADVHSALQAVKDRQFRYIEIPTGLDPETVGAMWATLNFSGVEKEPSEKLPDHYFREPTSKTQELRSLARAGGEETMNRLLEEHGQDKVWLGGTMTWEELQVIQELVRKNQELAVAVQDEGNDSQEAIEKEWVDVHVDPETVTSQPVSGEDSQRRGWTTKLRPGSSSGPVKQPSTRPGSNQGYPASPISASTPNSPLSSSIDLPRSDSFSSLRRLSGLTLSPVQDDSATVNQSSRASFSKSLSNMMGALSRTSTREDNDKETRGRTLVSLSRVKSASSVPPEGESERSRSRPRSTSPFMSFRRRRTEPSPPPLAVHLSHSDAESDADSTHIRPRRTAFSYDSGDETVPDDVTDYEDDSSDDGFFDDLTERNTEQNAQLVPPVPLAQAAAAAEEADPDPLGEGVNVVVPPEPYFPSTLNSTGRTKRSNPRRRKSTKNHEPLNYETSRPVFQRDRCTITITQGDPVGKLGERRKRRYVVASDLSEESRYAVEWAIGTVLRDGDNLLIVTVNENDGKVDPPIPNASDRTTKLRSQQERQGLAYILVRQVTSLLQRTKLNVKVTCQAWHAKNARHMLLDIVDYNEPQMVIVGSRGLGQLKGILLGSTSHYLIQKCSVPVMVARRRLKRPPRRSAHLSTHRTHVSLAEAGIDRVVHKVDEDVQVMREEIQRDDDRRNGQGVEMGEEDEEEGDHDDGDYHEEEIGISTKVAGSSG
ncbi:hypothetical protein H0H93_015536 [Arthromyces matolae]|nr:hypothetical protein H0H93_015536 [Arthromyces matolae]